MLFIDHANLWLHYDMNVESTMTQPLTTQTCLLSTSRKTHITSMCYCSWSSDAYYISWKGEIEDILEVLKTNSGKWREVKTWENTVGRSLGFAPKKSSLLEQHWFFEGPDIFLNTLIILFHPSNLSNDWSFTTNNDCILAELDKWWG